MCGIAGCYLKEKADREDLLAMTRSLAHRGPDGEGLFTDGGVGLGHRRLSIIDLKTGDQPMFSENGNVVVVYNGEIYNFRELRDELSRKGHDFRTSSDTEVLVHLYEQEGDLFPDRLDGIFSFALFDRKRRALLLGRDPLGVKPLYYAHFPGGLLFGSEPKSLLRHRGFAPSIDTSAAALYFQMEYYPAPLTPFMEMKKLLPGHVLVAGSHKDSEVIPYTVWKFDDLSLADDEDIVRLVRETVVSSVSSQLVSDVPLGVFLSGGVDSACVAASMKEAGADIRSFSVGFEDPRFDESRQAREAARFIGARHSERIFSEADLLGRIGPVLAAMDEPLADPSVFPTSMLSAFAREQVTVALGGDGGDELFCGYPTYLVHKYFPFYRRTPGFIRRPLLSIADKTLPTTDGNLTFSYKMRKFMDGAEKEMPERHFAWMGAFSREKLSKLMPGIGLDLSPISWIGAGPSPGRVADAEWLDMRTYLMEDVLQKVDRMSMLSSLEVRVPLLSRRMVRLAFSIPEGRKIRGTTLKRLLKKAFCRDLPPRYFNRPKKGFAIPMARWLKGPLREEVRDTLNSPAPPFMDGCFVSRLMEEHIAGRKDNRKLVWSAHVFLKWYRELGRA